MNQVQQLPTPMLVIVNVEKQQKEVRQTVTMEKSHILPQLQLAAMNHDSIAAYSNASHCECGKTASLVKLAVTVKLEEQQA